jgi:anti-sigma B factor antagonist
MPLTVTAQERQAGIFTVYPAGSLDGNTSHLLEARLHAIRAASPRVIVLDLKDLAYISSAGIRVIVATMKAMRQAGGSVALTNLQPQIRKVFDIIGALPSLRIFESVGELDTYLDYMQKKVTQGEE